MATPWGWLSSAAPGGPPSPAVPFWPEPATLVIVPSAGR
jgi:hypothetical protein